MWTRNLLRSRISSLRSTQYNWDLLQEPFKSLSKSAILVPLVLEDDIVKVWLTKRSGLVRHHKGEVAFPGGMKEPQDANAFETATREAFEKIGLDSSEVELVAELPSSINDLEIIVTPIVGIVSSNFCPKPSDEVAFSFKLPLERFLMKRDHWTVDVDISSFKDSVHCFRDVVREETVVTGPMTAAVAIQLACGVFQKSSEFPFSQHVDLIPEDPFRFFRQYMDAAYHHFTNKKSKL